MTDYSIAEEFPSKYMNAESVKRTGILTIETVTKELVGQVPNQQEKLVIQWRELTVQPLIMNATNAKVLAKAYGDSTTAWTGKQVVVYTVETQFGPGVRVRIPGPADAELVAPF